MKSLSRKKILICGFDLRLRLRLIDALRSNYEIITEPDGLRTLRRLRTEDVDCVLIIVNKRSLSDQLRLFREILTEERRPPPIALLDPYCCLPNPEHFVKNKSLSGYACGDVPKEQIDGFLGDVFRQKKPMLLEKEPQGRKIWKRIRS